MSRSPSRERARSLMSLRRLSRERARRAPTPATTLAPGSGLHALATPSPPDAWPYIGTCPGSWRRCSREATAAIRQSQLFPMSADIPDRTSGLTNTEASARGGSGVSGVPLCVRRRPERQTAAGFSGADNREATFAPGNSARLPAGGVRPTRKTPGRRATLGIPLRVGARPVLAAGALSWPTSPSRWCGVQTRAGYGRRDR